MKAIIEMVHHTRLGTIASAVGIMRMAFAQAVRQISERRAFQKLLIDQPAMRSVIADLALEYEAAVGLMIRVARAYGDTSETGRAFARLAVALAKYRLTKRCPDFVYECMECHGGMGYIEETPMPRLYREAPVNAIWEGSGNIIALDVLRTLQREPLSLEAYAAEIAQARTGSALLDRAADALLNEMSDGPSDADARRLVEVMALVLQSSLLIRHAPAPVAEAFIRSRLGKEGGASYGTLPPGIDIPSILDRQHCRK